MWTEFQRSGIFDDVVQWRTLSTVFESLTFVSACWWFCFPEMSRPPVPAYEEESVQHLAHLDMILEVLTLVRIALQIPTTAVSHTRHAAAKRYELHRCRMTASLRIYALFRKTTDIFHHSLKWFISTRRRCCGTSCILHLRINGTSNHSVVDFRTYMTSYRILDIINNRVSTSGYHHGILRTTLEPQIRMSYVVNILDAASIYNSCVASTHSLNLLFITGNLHAAQHCCFGVS